LIYNFLECTVFWKNRQTKSTAHMALLQN